MLTVAPSTVDPATALRSRLIGFTGFLRANGYGIAGGDSAGILETAEAVGAFDGEILRWSLKARLCRRGDEWRRFDPLFDAYFLPPNRRAFEHRMPGTEGDVGTPGAGDTPNPSSIGISNSAGADDDPAARHGASREESLAATDFRDLDRADQLREIEALMRRFARRLKHVRLRREARFCSGRRLDLPTTIRRSIGSGGTPFQLAWKDRRRVRPRLVLLLDVSRSMSAYSFFYLRLARALVAELEDVHCFIFHTRITGVGDALRDPDPWRSQERLHLLSEGWGGGTRIGECLAEWNRGQGSRLVHARTGVIVVSDGYDTGGPDLLATTLGAMRRRARRLVWLNPLLGQPGFRPEGQAMRAALPHLDLFGPGADLASIERTLPDLIGTLR
jgi:uncharacterized protein with von Willebrand factor type A (vWA) domain